MANLSNINNKFLVTTGGNGHSMIILDHASSANNYSQVRFSNAGSAKFAIGIDPQDSYKQNS